MKKILTLIMLMGAMTAAEAQTMVLNLDSCRIGAHEIFAKGRCHGRI